jgi:hypothetical protein
VVTKPVFVRTAALLGFVSRTLRLTVTCEAPSTQAGLNRAELVTFQDIFVKRVTKDTCHRVTAFGRDSNSDCAGRTANNLSNLRIFGFCRQIQMKIIPDGRRLYTGLCKWVTQRLEWSRGLQGRRGVIAPRQLFLHGLSNVNSKGLQILKIRCFEREKRTEIEGSGEKTRKTEEKKLQKQRKSVKRRGNT